MRVWKAAAAAGLLGLLATTATLPGGTASAATSGPDVRVGSFNILTVSADKTASGERKSWKVRRAAIVSQVTGQDLDVLGVQEANQRTYWADHLVDGRTQYLDLRNGLNAAGGSFALTSTAPFNCRDAWSERKCTYQNRAASGDNRILYNTETLSVVGRGAYRYRHQDTRIGVAYLAWARLRVRATGQTFLFGTTHLAPGNETVRVAQWQELIARVNSLKGGNPVVLTGDFNTMKYSKSARTLLPAMVSNGYGDALGQHYATNGTVPRPTTLDHVWINSLNRFDRDVRNWSYEQDRGNTRDPNTGNGIDWIFASNDLTIPRYSVVVTMDEPTLRLTGTIPSDHCLVTATVRLR